MEDLYILRAFCWDHLSSQTTSSTTPWATPLGLAIQVPMPMTVSSTLPSVGSILHGTGTCKPCAWFWKPQAGWDGYKLVLDFDFPPKKNMWHEKSIYKSFRKWFWQRSITRYHKVFMATFLLNWLHSLVAYYFLLKIDRFVRGHGRQTKDTDMYERRWHLAIGMQMHAKLHPFRQPGMQQWSRLWSLSHVLLGEMANDYCLNTARTSQTCLLHPETT